MNQGVEGSRFPYIPLRISLALAELTVEALVDTGFDGDVVLPSTVVSGPASGQPDAFLTWRLADGSDVVTGSYLATASIPGLPGLHSVLVSVLGDESIVGRGLTDHYRVVFDHGERVIIEP
ncbi:MAG TPA: hypothetical protein VI876_13625 [Dehalococcoidia bacterium]|nr:hypothetical protein [Dehalococcoidia bacterium]